MQVTNPIQSQLAARLGHGVRVAMGPIAPEAIEALTAAEVKVIQRAVPKRRAEFATGRALAHGLLEDHGDLLLDRDRAPMWPDGRVGSIAHCDDLCVVAVADTKLRGLGIDVEPNAPLERGLWNVLFTADEIARLQDDGRLARCAFSAKESTYKAFYPLLRRIVEFREVELTFEGSRFAATGQPIRSLGLDSIEGFVHTCDDWIFTGATIRSGT